MIKSIFLKNWRTHENTELTFVPGVNVLIGQVGSGKTSVLEGISFALYGKIKRTQTPNISLGEYVRDGTDECVVRLTFIHNDKEYCVERRIRRRGSSTPTTAILYEDGKVVETGTQRVNERIWNILKVDFNMFTNVVYSEQNAIDHLLTLKKSSRKEEMDKLLGLDRFEKARANMRKVVNYLEKDIKSLEKEVSEEKIKELKQAINKLDEQIKTIHAKRKEMETKVKDAKERINSLKLLLDKEKRKREEYESVRTRLIEAETNIKVLKSRLKERVPFTDADRNRLSSLRDLLNKLKDEEKKMNQQIRQTIGERERVRTSLETNRNNVTKMNRMKQELNRLLEGKSIEEIKEWIETEKKVIEDLKDKVSQSQALIKELDETIETLKKISKEGSGKCPVCGSPLTEEHIRRLIDERMNTRSGLNERIETYRKEIDNRVKNLEKNDFRYNKARELLIKIKALTVEDTDKLKKEYEKLSDLCGSLETQLERIRKDLSETEREIRELELKEQKDKEMKKVKETLVQLNTEVKTLKDKLGQLEFDPKRLESIEHTYNEAVRNKVKMEGELNVLDKELYFLNQQLKRAEDDLSREKRKMEGLAKLKKLRDISKVLEACIIETQGIMRDRLISAINQALETVWPVIYPYKDYKKIRITATKDDYRCEVCAVREDGEQWLEAVDRASGGERATIGLALRIACAMVLTPSLNWLILDEPTTNLDELVKKTLAEALIERVPEIVAQTFVISHEIDFLNHDFDAIYRFSRNKESNDPTVYERIK